MTHCDVCAVCLLFVLLVISFSLNCVQSQAYLLSFYCMLLCFSVLPNAKPPCVSFCLAVLYCKEDTESSDLKETGEEGMFEWDDIDVLNVCVATRASFLCCLFYKES